MLKRTFFCSLFGVATLFGAACQASLIWSIDSQESFIRLNIPDQTVALNDEGDEINALLRDYQDEGGPVFTGDPDVPAAWTDGNGRRSFVGGTLNAAYSEGAGTASIEFLPGTHSASAIEYGAFRPSPDEVLGPAAFAADVWGTEVVDEENEISVYGRLGHVRIRDINYDLSGTVGMSEGPVGSFTQSSGSIDLGVLSGAVVDVDLAGLFTEFGLPLPEFGGTNLGNILVENIGGLNRRLTITVDIPIVLDLQGLPLSASIDGVLVAYAVIPEPTSVSLVAVSMTFIAFRRRRAGI